MALNKAKIEKAGFVGLALFPHMIVDICQGTSSWIVVAFLILKIFSGLSSEFLRVFLKISKKKFQILLDKLRVWCL